MTASRTAAGNGAAGAVYTYGWDTVFAIPVPEVNKAIVDHKSSPPSFSVAQQGFTLAGKFGDWQICQGGDGKSVRMSLPLSQVVLTFTSTGKRFTFDSGTAVVEIQLHYVPHTGASPGAAAGSNPLALKANPASSDPEQPVFNVITLSLSPQPGTITQAVISSGLAAWGAANLADFAHVFAVVDINTMIDKGGWSFVAPNYTSYAYIDGDSLADSIFGVLTMTGDRGPGQNVEQLSPGAIPAGSVGGFLVSNQRALLDLVRPAIMQAYPGLTVDNFQLNAQNELYLLDGVTVGLQPVEKNSNTYYPELTSLTVQSLDTLFTLVSYTTTEVASGITAWCQTTHQYTIQLGSSNNGQTLGFTTVGDPVVNHGITQSPGSQLTQLIIEIAAGVALVLVTVLTDGAAAIAGGMVIGLLLGADQIVPSLIKQLNTDDSPAIDLLTVNAVAPIVWTNSGVFQLDYGSMNNAMQLGGDPKFI